MGQRTAANLTKRICDAAAPRKGADGKPGEALFWDAAVSGFGLRVTAAGHRSFILLYRAGKGRGAPVRKWTIGSYGSPWTVDTARTEAKRLLGEIVGGNDPAMARSQVRLAKREAREAELRGEDVPGSVAAVVKDWLHRDQGQNKDVDGVRRIMEREVIPFIGTKQLADVRKRDIIEVIDRVADRAPVRANRVLAHLKRLFHWAAGRDLIEASPAQFVEKPAAESKRERVLTDAELVEIWHALDHGSATFAAGVRLLILSAARLSEVFEAEWPELDAAGTALSLPPERAKSKEGRRIHLVPRALRIIEALPRYADCQWMLTVRGATSFNNFGDAKAMLDKRIMAARRKAAEDSGGDPGKAVPMPDWRLHDVRRTVATAMQRAGARLEAVEHALGHVSGSRGGVVGVYQRYEFEDEARAAVEAWGRHVDGLLDPKLAKVVPMRRKRTG